MLDKANARMDKDLLDTIGQQSHTRYSIFTAGASHVAVIAQILKEKGVNATIMQVTRGQMAQDPGTNNPALMNKLGL